MALKLNKAIWAKKILDKFPKLKVLDIQEKAEHTAVGLRSHLDVTLFCSYHKHTWQTTAYKVLQTKYGCPKCKSDNVSVAISESLSPISLIKDYLDKTTHYIKCEGKAPSKDASRTYQVKLHCTKCNARFNIAAALAKKLESCPMCEDISRVGSRSAICNNWLGDLSNIYGIKIQGFNGKEKWIRVDGKRMAVDGYHEDSNTVFEFLGDYWHGNPKGKTAARKKEYQETIERLITLSRNYNVIYVWETDYKVDGIPFSGFLGNGVIPFLK